MMVLLLTACEIEAAVGRDNGSGLNVSSVSLMAISGLSTGFSSNKALPDLHINTVPEMRIFCRRNPLMLRDPMQRPLHNAET